MPAALDVNKEEYRMLVLDLGYAETARRTGLKEGTLRQWGNRGGWLEHLKNPPQLPASVRPVTVTGVTKPADALTEMLADDERETKVSLSKTTRRLAKNAESATLDQAGDVLQVAKTAALVHRWQDVTGPNSVVINLALLAQPPEEKTVTDI